MSTPWGNLVRRSTSLFLLAAILLCMCTQSALAEQPFFMGLGDLPGGEFGSRAFEISGDGSTVIGDAHGITTSFLWTKAGGMVDIVSLTGLSSARDVSYNGSVVVGSDVWSSAHGIQSYGSLPGPGWTSAAAISGDGLTVVGEGNGDAGGDSSDGRQAFRWTSAAGIVGLGDLPGGLFNSMATDVSTDGSVIAGYSYGAAGREAFRWTQASGMVGLGDLPGGSYSSTAYGISADGSTIVGVSRSSSGIEAFRWTQASGMVGLGDLPGGSFASQARAASADGSVIVGAGFTNVLIIDAGSISEAVIWDAAHGMRSLRDLLVVNHGLNLSGWILKDARDISHDGRTIVGIGINPQGLEEAWVAHLGPVPEPASFLLLGICASGLVALKRFPRRLTRPQAYSGHKPARHRPAFEHLEDRRVMAADFASAFSVGGALSEQVYDLALDGSGNTCVVGGFSGIGDFDPSAGAYELSGGGTFAAKYDTSSNLLWAQRVGASNSWFNFGPEIAAGADGSVYVVGTFANSAVVGSTTLISAGADDAYVVKLDADGNFAWANRIGGVGADWGNDVKVDANGNVYVMAETRSSASGSPDATIVKLDAAGNTLWTYTAGATSSSSTTTKGKNTTTTSSGGARGFKLGLDAAGDVYATGKMNGLVDFDPGSGVVLRTGDGFILKLSTHGSLLWVRETVTGANATRYGTIEPHDIAVTANGRVYATGLYDGRLDFNPQYDPKSKKLIAGWELDAGAYETYVTAFDSNGTLLWAKSTQNSTTTGTNISPYVEAIAVDGTGDVYVTGRFNGTTDFEPGSGAYSLTAAAGEDSFIWKLDATGSFAWAGQISGAGGEHDRGIAVDTAGNIVVAGTFNGTADFDPSPGTYNLTSSGVTDVFVAKLTQSANATLATSRIASQTTSVETGGTYSASNSESNDHEASHRRNLQRAKAFDKALTDFDDRLSELLLLLA